MDDSLYSFVSEFIAFLRIFILLSLLVYFVLFILYADANLTLLFYHYLNRPRDFRNKVVWITETSSGIGEHLAYDLVKLGAKLAISGASIERLRAVAERCKEISNIAAEDILLVPFQINNLEVHDECVNKVLDHFGQIDILVNNACTTQRAKFADSDIAAEQQFYDINVSGTINLTSQVLSHFLELKKGHIVATSSIAWKFGLPVSFTYAGSKHELHGYFESLRREMMDENIDITLVCPGPIFSRMTDRVSDGEVRKEGDLNQEIACKKMAIERCSDLTATAIAYRLKECWISLQPLLLTFYIAQYFPTKFKTLCVRKRETMEIEDEFFPPQNHHSYDNKDKCCH